MKSLKELLKIRVNKTKELLKEKKKITPPKMADQLEFRQDKKA